MDSTTLGAQGGWDCVGWLTWLPWLVVMVGAANLRCQFMRPGAVSRHAKNGRLSGLS